MRYASHSNRRSTPQSESAQAEQVKNRAGGFVFQIGDWAMLDRFLVLGAEGNTYYAAEREMTRANAAAVERCIKEDGKRTVARIVEISHAGRAPKNDPALFALALCASADDVATRQAALVALPKVARIGTFLFAFIDSVLKMRGWGRALRNAVARAYYELPDAEKIAFNAVKYQQRGGWSHRDLLRLTHPKVADAQRRATLAWVAHPERAHGGVIDVSRLTAGTKAEKPTARSPETTLAPLPAVIASYEQLKRDPSVLLAVRHIREYGLQREMIPTELLNSAEVWDALLEDMPMTAMIRNLGKMSAVGLLKPFSERAATVASRLIDAASLKKARVHPIAVLMALNVYSQGHGDKGKLVWEAAPKITDALDQAFYLAFDSVVPTGKRRLLALDVSGSMGFGQIAGTALTPREAAAAMALVTLRTEDDTHIVGFTSGNAARSSWGYSSENGVSALKISARQRLDDVVNYTAGLSFGRTDAALPMLYAIKNSLHVDSFEIYTDNETWAGAVHPFQALEQYRQKSGIAAKMIAVGMTATEHSVCDPKDVASMNVVGFDAAAPTIMADFIRGE